MSQQVISFLSTHLFLVLVLLIVGIALVVPKLKGLQHWWMSFETRAIRPVAERRDLFLKYAFIFLVVGISAACYQASNPVTQWGRFVFDSTALLMAVLGFFFTIYGIKGVLERPQSLDEVLIRTTESIKKYEAKKGCTAVLLCEYPAWGALSRQRTQEYVDFSNVLKRFLDAGTNRQLVLVAPNDDGMKKRIGQYAKDYGRTAAEVEAAQRTNETLVRALQGLGDSDEPNSFKRWKIEQAPRYQMLLVGEQTKGERGLSLLEAIVWFAPRCSDIKEGEVTTLAPETNHEAKIKIGEEVPILAWHTTAPDALDELYDSAFFYARFYAQGSKPQSYNEFLV